MDKKETKAVFEKMFTKKLGMDEDGGDAFKIFKMLYDNPDKAKEFVNNAKDAFGGIFNMDPGQQQQNNQPTFSDEERRLHMGDPAYESAYVKFISGGGTLITPQDIGQLAPRKKELTALPPAQRPEPPKEEQKGETIEVKRAGKFDYTAEEEAECNAKFMYFVDYLNKIPAADIKKKFNAKENVMCNIYTKFKLFIDIRVDAKTKNYFKHVDFDENVKNMLKGVLKHDFLTTKTYWAWLKKDFEQLKKLL